MARRQFPTDYDSYAPTYARVRQPVAWVSDPLARIARELPARSTVVEIGCGTGNYIHALAATRPDLTYMGFDLSEAMVREACARGGRALFAVGDATRGFPCCDDVSGLAFTVDVVHHLDRLDAFFAEAARVLASDGRLTVVTDSESTMRRRSLTRFFPELMEIELARYPELAELHGHAARVGLRLVNTEIAEGRIPLSDAFVERLGAKCSSAMRLITDTDHAAGIARVREAQSRGESWLSSYEMLHYAA